MSVHPDLRWAARLLPGHFVGPLSLRLLRAAPPPPAAMPPGIDVAEIPLPGGARARVIAAPAAGQPRPALVWIHGGGFVIGAARQDDGRCGVLAAALGAVVVSVEYRLAPEHPYPAPLDDCLAAYRYALEHAGALGIDPLRVAVGGMSAGGGLAAGLVHRIADAGLPRPVLQLLSYPMLDDRTALRDDVDPGPLRLWSPTSNRFGWTSYLGGPPGGADVPDHAAPARRADLTGAPPAWIGVGTNDLFHDEDVAYAERLKRAGVPTTLMVVPGAFHGFDVAAPRAPVSRAFVDAQIAALREAFA